MRKWFSSLHFDTFHWLGTENVLLDWLDFFLIRKIHDYFYLTVKHLVTKYLKFWNEMPLNKLWSNNMQILILNWHITRYEQCVCIVMKWCKWPQKLEDSAKSLNCIQNKNVCFPYNLLNAEHISISALHSCVFLSKKDNACFQTCRKKNPS